MAFHEPFGGGILKVGFFSHAFRLGFHNAHQNSSPYGALSHGPGSVLSILALYHILVPQCPTPVLQGSNLVAEKLTCPG